MSTSELRDYATAMAATVALLVFIVNALSQSRSRRIENLVPRHTQMYMFGSYAPRILGLLTDQERASMFWELAVGYLNGVAKDSERYAKLTRADRARFWRQQPRPGGDRLQLFRNALGARLDAEPVHAADRSQRRFAPPSPGR